MRYLPLIPVFLVLASIPTVAQVEASYLFLEVKDSAGRPVKDARVEIRRYYGVEEPSINVLHTDERGAVRFSPPYPSPARSGFAVSKEGYYTYHDLGVKVDRDSVKAVLELFKIPQIEAERRTLGDEQLKRDFLWAARRGDAAALRDLLKRGISPNLNTGELRGIPGPPGVPAIVLAAGSADGEAVKVLLDAGSDIKGNDKQLRNILSPYLWNDPFKEYRPADDAERQAKLRKYETGVEALLEAGAPPDPPEYDYERPIALAASKGYTRTVKMLLDRGVSPKTKTLNGETVLMRAAAGSYGDDSSRAPVIRLLLERGADPNEPTVFACWSALGKAAERGDVESMRLLVEKGAKVNNGCNGNSAPSAAVYAGKTRAVEFLLDAGADVSAFGPRGERIIPSAVEKGDAEMVKMLIRRGFPVDGKLGNRTALMVAIEQRYSQLPELVDALLEAGADPNSVAVLTDQNGDCTTPLMLAVKREEVSIVRSLIAKKADINFACPNGESVLIKAMTGTYSVQMVRTLLEAGIGVRGQQGSQAMELLKTSPWRVSNAEKVRQLLEAAGAK